MMFEIGERVKFNHANGSVGTVEHVRADGPFRSDPVYYVRWHYGIGRDGAMTSLSGMEAGHTLKRISEDEFDDVAWQPKIADLPPPMYVNPLTLTRVRDEVMRARAKFPRNRLLLAALTEEAGELAKALLQRRSRSEIEAEAIQVAAVALRIIEESDATFADVTDAEAKP